MSITFLRGCAVWMMAAAWLLCAAGAARAAQDDDGANPKLVPPLSLNERVLTIPGDPARPVTLEVTVFTPVGAGPFPLAVMNHGATAASATNRGSRYRYTFSAYYFLSRGYAVVMPMMRGFAGSGGTLTPHGCDVGGVALGNAKDIRAVIDYFRTQPGIDASRIIVAGQSFGGWNTLALGTLGVPGVRGLVSFSGGMRESDCSEPFGVLPQAAAVFGAHTHLPSLWFFGENDSQFPTQTWRAMYQRYTAAGGKASLVDIGSFMDDSHQMLSHSESIPIWAPRLDQFLASLGLPSTAVEPRYLPTPIPPDTHYAAIDDVARVPYLNDNGRAAYRTFLTQKAKPRVFFVTPSGGSGMTYGGFDPIARASADCATARVACQIYAVDNTVVWSPQERVEPVGAQQLRRVVRADAMTVLVSATRLNPDCSVLALPVLRITQMPKDGTAVVSQGMAHPTYPPGSQLSACDARMVPMAQVTYTPRTGFTGADAVVFEETRTDQRHVAYDMELTVH